MTPTNAPAAGPSRRPLMMVVVGCAVLLLCVVVVGAGGLGAWFLTRSQAAEVEPAVEYVLDASPRMTLADASGTRLTVAQGVLAEIVRPASPDLTAGLRVFGTGVQTDTCKDTDLVVPLALSNQNEISSRALEVQAGAAADAAMGEAMLAAIRDLSTTDGPHTLVVITGGADACNPEAGQLIAQEAERAGVDLQTFVVGYQVPDEEAEAIRGMVEDAGDTTYLNALDADELRKILEAIQTYVDDPTTTFPTVTLGTPAPVALTPQATPVAGATSAGIATAEPGSTTAPTAVGPGPDSTAAVVPGETPGTGSGYVAQTACDHPYFPLRQGATWTYAFSEGTYTWSVTSVSGDLDNAEAVMHLAMTDLAIDYHWTCTRDGIVSYDFGSFNVGGEGSFTFEVNSAEGTWLPPAELLVPGYAWVNNYSMETSIDGGGQSLTAQTTVNESRTVTGIENAASEAGEFETLRVDSSGNFTTDMAGLGTTSFPTSSTAWFAYGIGMIRNESTSEGAGSTTTLVSYSIP